MGISGNGNFRQFPAISKPLNPFPWRRVAIPRYLLLFFLPGFLVDKVNTDLGTAAAAQSTLASILCVLLPLSTYCIAWCVLFPRILKFAEHSRALYAKVTKSKTA